MKSLEDIRAELSFVNNEPLRENLSVAVHYIYFLVQISASDTVRDPVHLYSIYKNIILYVAAVAEALTYHAIELELQSGKVGKDALRSNSDKVYSDKKEIFKFEDGSRILAVTERNRRRTLSDLQFQELIRAARRISLFDRGVESQINVLRERRNKIHLAGLKSPDDSYDPSDVKNALKSLGNLIKLVKKNAETL